MPKKIFKDPMPEEMREELLQIIYNMEAHMKSLAEFAARAKKLIEGEDRTAIRTQRSREIGAAAVAKRNAFLYKSMEKAKNDKTLNLK